MDFRTNRLVQVRTPLNRKKRTSYGARISELSSTSFTVPESLSVCLSISSSTDTVTDEGRDGVSKSEQEDVNLLWESPGEIPNQKFGAIESESEFSSSSIGGVHLPQDKQINSESVNEISNCSQNDSNSVISELTDEIGTYEDESVDSRKTNSTERQCDETPEFFNPTGSASGVGCSCRELSDIPSRVTISVTSSIENVNGDEMQTSVPERHLDACSRGTTYTKTADLVVRPATSKTVQFESRRSNPNNIDVSRRIRWRKRDVKGRIKFGSVSVREYEQILCDNPAVVSGPSIGLGWNYTDNQNISVHEWERIRESGRCSNKSGLIITHGEREAMLSKLGYSQEEIDKSVRSSTKIKEQRLETIDNLDAQPLEEFFEMVVRRMKRVLVFLPCRRKRIDRNEYRKNGKYNNSEAARKVKTL